MIFVGNAIVRSYDHWLLRQRICNRLSEIPQLTLSSRHSNFITIELYLQIFNDGQNLEWINIMQVITFTLKNVPFIVKQTPVCARKVDYLLMYEAYVVWKAMNIKTY